MLSGGTHTSVTRTQPPPHAAPPPADTAPPTLPPPHPAAARPRVLAGNAAARSRVRTGPGSTELTRNLVIRSSPAQVSTRCSAPAFEAPYGPQYASGSGHECRSRTPPAPPSACRSSGSQVLDQPPRAAQVHRENLVPVVRQRCAAPASDAQPPALCTRMSSRPKRWKHARAERVDLAGSRRSSGSSVAAPPAARIASSVSSSPPWVRAVITTCAPRRAEFDGDGGADAAAGAGDQRDAADEAVRPRVAQRHLGSSRLSWRFALSRLSGSGIG